MGEGRQVAFRRPRGPNQWASVRELVAPDRFAARIRRELGLAPARFAWLAERIDRLTAADVALGCLRA